MPRSTTVILCDDDPLFHQTIKLALNQKYEVLSAFSVQEAKALLKAHPVQILLLDVSLSTAEDGLRFIPEVREADPDVAIVMCSGRTDFPTVREALRLGAKDYLAKGCEPEEIELMLERVLGQISVRQSNRRQAFEVAANHRKHLLVGGSGAMQSLQKTVQKIKPSAANVVIYGETGTGKEVVARQLRKTLANGAPEPFVAIDSATIQGPLAESHLFGHEKGAFTGADQLARGAFEEAHGGVIYFDELANMSLEIQAKLLRVLQEKEIRRVGGTKTIPLEFRVIAATNQPLEQLVEQGKFKPDLLQRLLVLPISIPALRERTEDIPALLDHFLRNLENRFGLLLTPRALEALKAYRWPGNVRELGNLASYLAVMVEGQEIDVADLPPKFTQSASGPPGDFYAAVEEFERSFLNREVSGYAGSTAELAAKLGIGRSHLYAKLKKYGITS